MRPGGKFEHCQDWAGKAPGAAARIAGILHVVEHAHGQPHNHDISAETMGRTLELMMCFAEHSLYALGIMSTDESIAAAQKAWAWVEGGRRGRFTLAEAHQNLKGSLPHADNIRHAFAVLVERGYVEIIEPSKSGPGRPPSPVVMVRPSILEGWQ